MMLESGDVKVGEHLKHPGNDLLLKYTDGVAE
jgi:hypothetical protein